MKLIENQVNSLPLGYAFGRDVDNGPVLNIISPAMLRHGRNNTRSLNGPIKLANDVSKMMAKVEDTYWAWFRIWRDSWVPKLIRAPKWYGNTGNVEVDDLVYFKRTPSEL